MRKLQYFSMFLLLLPFVFAGSAGRHLREKPALPLLVTQIRVAGHDGSNTLSRQYTQPAKIGHVLRYLRWLDHGGIADTDPEQLTGSSFDITIYYSDGQTRIYRQRADRYLSKNCRPWEKIDPEQAHILLPLLRALPSDSSAAK